MGAMDAMQQRLAEALLDPARRAPRGLAVHDGSAPERRFAVHRNNVTKSLVDALAHSLPVVQALVGETFFRAMAAEFVRRHPPAHAVLALYGDAMPAFLDGFAPASVLPYLADVARLELARGQALNAADADALAPQALQQALADAGSAAVRLRSHPSLRVLRLRHAALSIWQAHQQEGDAAIASALAAIWTDEAQDVLVLRDPGDTVLAWRLGPGAATFVQALAVGVDVAAAHAAAVDDDARFDLAETLLPLVTHGGVIAVEPATQPLTRGRTT